MDTFNRRAVIFASFVISFTATLSANIPLVELQQVHDTPGPFVWDCSYMMDNEIVLCYSKKSWITQEWTRCNCSWQRQGPLIYQSCEQNIECEWIAGNRCGKPTVRLNCATCCQNNLWATDATIFHYPDDLVKSLPIGVPLLAPIGTTSATYRPSTSTPHQPFSTSESTTAPKDATPPVQLRPGTKRHAKMISQTAEPLLDDCEWMISNQSSPAPVGLGRRTDRNENVCRIVVRGRGFLNEGGNHAHGGEGDQGLPRYDEEAWVRLYFPQRLTIENIQDTLWRGLVLEAMVPKEVNSTDNLYVCGRRFLTTGFYLDKAKELGSVQEFLNHLLVPGFRSAPLPQLGPGVDVE